MPWTVQLRRHSEYSARGSPARNSHFVPQLSVALRNDYFPSGCLDSAGIVVEPGACTAALMKRLSLILIDQPDGFVVAYESNRSGSGRLKNEIERSIDYNDPVRLGFLVRFEDPLFVNYSDVPFTLNPMSEALYLDNLKQLQTSQPYTVRDSATDRLQVVPSKFRVAFRKNAAFIAIRNLFGQDVRFYSRLVSHAVDGERNPGEHTRREQSSLGELLASVYVDLATLPEGKYEIVFLNREQKDIASGGWHLYLSGAKTPLLFIDVVFAPKGYHPPGAILTGTPGILMRQRLQVPPAGAALLTFEFEIDFRAREIRFQYLVVLPTADNPYHQLRIAADHPAEISFTVTEDHFQGHPALIFTAERALPLRQVPDYRFSLHGRDERRGGGECVLVEKLPVPGPDHLTVFPVPLPVRQRIYSSKAYVYI